MATQKQIEAAARAISPEWFDLFEDGTCAIDNYPGQHLKYQEWARQKAKAALEAAGVITNETEE